MRLSIRYKILGVLGILLLAAVGFYTLLASFIFVEQKTALLYEINHSIAVNTAAQIRSSLHQVSDQLKLYAVSRLLNSKSELLLPASALRDNHILAIGFFLKTANGFESQKLPPDLPGIENTPTDLQSHLEKASTGGQSFWRTETNTGHCHYWLASRLDLTIDAKPYTYVTVAELDGKPFFELLQSANLFESFLMRPDGEVLAHYNTEGEAPAVPLREHPLLQTERKPAQVSGVQSYTYAGTQWYGAFAPVGMGDLFFISQADQSQVNSALSTLLQRSLLFGLIVATATFIASILFSKRLTRNLFNLTQGALRIGGGDLNAHIQVRSGDEVEALAKSFNQMVDALRASREAIETYNRELEDKIALRTQELRETNASIKAVQEKLVQTSQLAAVGEVAGQTAHELLNPLTAILSRLERSRLAVQPGAGVAVPSLPAQLLEILQAWREDYTKGGLTALSAALAAPSQINPKQTLLDEDLENLQKLATYWQNQTTVVSTDLDFVREQAQRIHRIVDKMRELIRASVKSQIHCKAAVQEAVSTMTDFLNKNGVRLFLDWQASADLALLNKDELIQILTNLFRNAYQAIQQGAKGQGLVSLQARNENEMLVLDVTDNGAGIPTEHQSKIFDQGFTTKAPSEGTGLGLAICRRYARAFGGEVALEFSEPLERGTCFRVTIPLLNPDVPV